MESINEALDMATLWTPDDDYYGYTNAETTSTPTTEEMIAAVQHATKMQKQFELREAAELERYRCPVCGRGVTLCQPNRLIVCPHTLKMLKRFTAPDPIDGYAIEVFDDGR